MSNFQKTAIFVKNHSKIVSKMKNSIFEKFSPFKITRSKFTSQNFLKNNRETFRHCGARCHVSLLSLGCKWPVTRGLLYFFVFFLARLIRSDYLITYLTYMNLEIAPHVDAEKMHRIEKLTNKHRDWKKRNIKTKNINDRIIYPIKNG